MNAQEHRRQRGRLSVRIAIVLLIVLAFAAGVIYLRPPPSPPQAQRVPRANQAGYVGPQACRECHPARVAEFLETNHYRTSRLPQAGDLTGNFTAGHNVYQTRVPELRFEMTRDGGRFLQTAIQVVDGLEQRRTEQIGLVYGGGTIDEVYHYWRGDRLFQLPIAYLNPIDDWGNAPNYPDGFANFSRETIPACLECHNTYVEHVAGSSNQYHRESMILGVTCERCHGPAQKHIEHHRLFPADDSGRHIVQPAALSRQQELDVCLQCHSEIEVPRQPPFSYRPGEPLEEYYRTHADRHPEDDISANQIEGLRQSECFRQTEMTCNTCHNPHIPEGPRNSAAAANSCFGCHQPNHCGAREELPTELHGQCIDCHMPRKGATNFTFHTRTGDYLPLIVRREHRIAAYPDASQELLSDWYSSQPDAASRERGQQLRSQLAERKRAAARDLADRQRFRASSAVYREALQLTPGDALLQAELEHVLDKLKSLVGLLRTAAQHSNAGQTDLAVETLTQALAIKPNHTSALNGLALALEEQGDLAAAAETYAQVLKIDPEFVDAYYNLGALLQSQGDLSAALEKYQQALEIAPLHAEARMNLGTAYFLLQQPQQAVEQFRTVLRTQPGYAQAHFNLAVALEAQGDLPGAVQHLRSAAQASPQWELPKQRLGLLEERDKGR